MVPNSKVSADSIEYRHNYVFLKDSLKITNCSCCAHFSCSSLSSLFKARSVFLSASIFQALNHTLRFLNTVLKDTFSTLPLPLSFSSLPSSGGRDPRPPPRIFEMTLDMLHTGCFLFSSILFNWISDVLNNLSISSGSSATEIS